MDAVVRYTIAQPGNEQVRSVNALVGETNDGGLNDIRGLHVTRDHVLEAIRNAKTGAGRGGRGRRRHRDDVLRLEGRHRHVVAQNLQAQRRRTPWACSRRRISAAT